MNNRLNIAYLGDGYSCNSIIESGFYEISNAANAPADNTNWLIVMMKSPRTSRGDVEAVQVAYSKATGAQWVRSSDGSVWTNWVEVGAGGGGDAAEFETTNVNSFLDIVVPAHALYAGVGQATYESLGGSLEDIATNLLGITTPTDNQTRLDAVAILAITAWANTVAEVRRPMISQSADPAVTDDTTKTIQGFHIGVGTTWLNTTSKDLFFCADATTGAAVWKKFTFEA
jgi:hypothetical protein